MKKQICTVCTLLATSSWLLGMEQQQFRPATAAYVAAHTQQQDHAQQQDMVKITSSHGGREYELNKHAAVLSQVLRRMLEIVEQDANAPIKLDFVDNQIAFVAAVLVRVSRASVEQQTQEQLAEIIIDIGKHFDLTFFDVLHLINYFDIPLAFNAITSVKSLPLPIILAATEKYNKLLAIVFDMAISTASPSRPSDDRLTAAPLAEQCLDRIGSVQLWRLFGRMLYPDCLRYAEVQTMFDSIKARFDEKAAKILLHEIVLGEYMQHHPELYSHPLQTFAGNGSTINTIAFSQNGKLIASGSDDGEINLWESSSGQIRKQIKASKELSIKTLAFSPDGTLIASGFHNGLIAIWDINGTLQNSFGICSCTVNSVAFSRDGTMLVSGNSSGEVILWNILTGLPIRTFENKGANYSTCSVAFSPDGQSIAASNNIGIRLWNVADGSDKGQLRSPDNTIIFSVAYSPDGSMIASASGDKKVQLWRVADKKLLHIFNRFSNLFQSVSYSLVAFSPDGRSIISGLSDHAIRFWSITDKKLVRRIEVGHYGFIHTGAVNPNGTMIASVSDHRRDELLEFCLVQLWGYRDLFEALRAPIATIAPVAVQAPAKTIAANTMSSKLAPVQTKPLFTPGFLEKAFADTARRAAAAQDANDDDEPVILPAPLPEEKK